MKTISILLFSLLIAFKAVPVYGQSKFHVHVDYNYLLGLSEKSDYWTIKSGLNGFDINIAGMYDVNKRLSVGGGLGLEKLYDPAYTIIPVFAKIIYSPIRSTDKPYIYTKFGYGIGTRISNAGLLFNPGLGYKLKFREHFALNFILGYHFQSIRYDIVSYSGNGIIIDKKTDSNSRHSLSFGIGFIF